MDKHGYFNFGVSASHMKAICDTAKILIVEVNQNMPRCLGGFGESVHITDVDMIVEGRNDPMGQMVSAPPTEIDKAVAKQVVERIPNGACLQLGIGGMPNAVGMLLCESDLKDMERPYRDVRGGLRRSVPVRQDQRRQQEYRPWPPDLFLRCRSQRVYDFLDDNRMCMGRSRQLCQRYPHHRFHR